MSAYWQRFTDGRRSRRSFLRAAGVAGAAGAALAVAGCSDTSTKTSSGSQITPLATTSADKPEVLNAGGTPKRGGTFKIADAAAFGTFDPHLGIALATAYFPRVYNVLVNQSAAKPGFMFFDLASSLEQPDPQTFVFKIRPGVKVTPNDMGVPERDLGAEDVKVNIERIQSTPAANSYAFMHDSIASVSTAADTVTIKTTRPYAWFLNRIGLYTSTIAPRELILGDRSKLSGAAAGAGPYRLTSLNEGDVANFVRNPNYYRHDDATGEQLPYVDGIDASVILDKTAGRAAFVSGQMHRYTPSGPEEAQTLAGDYTIQRDPNFSFIAFTMNFSRPPFDDPRVRTAFSRAINRDDFVRVVYSGEAKPDGLVHWSVGDFAIPQDELATYQPYNLDEAKSLVQQVGGIKVKMMYPESTLLEHNLHLPIFLRQMRDAGIEIEEDVQPLVTWIDNYHGLNYQCSLALNQIYETAEIPLNFHTTSGPLGDGSYVRGMGDPEIEAAVQKTREILDLGERVQAVRDTQKLIYAKAPGFLPLVTPFSYQAYQKTVHDIPGGVGTTQNILNTFWLDS
jgi:ABC-type transport system substrate-binding protein